MELRKRAKKLCPRAVGNRLLDGKPGGLTLSERTLVKIAEPMSQSKNASALHDFERLQRLGSAVAMFGSAGFPGGNPKYQLGEARGRELTREVMYDMKSEVAIFEHSRGFAFITDSSARAVGM